MPTAISAKLPSLMRALEQRFLFDGAALVDPVWLTGEPLASAMALVTSKASQVTPVEKTPADLTQSTQDNATNTSEKKSDPVIHFTPAADSSASGGASIEEKPALPQQLAMGIALGIEKLVDATYLTAQKLSSFANSEKFSLVINQNFGHAGADAIVWDQVVAKLKEALAQSELDIRLEVLPASVMNGVLGAYTMDAGDGLETIYLNAELLGNLSPLETLVAVQIEEMGHAIDHRLNGLNDSPGNEGEALSDALMVGNHPTLLNGDENDHAVLIIDGVAVDVECASPSLSTSSNIAYFENSSPIVINSSIVPSDADGTLKTATIAVISFQASDTLSFTPITSGNPHNRTGPIIVKSNANGILTLWAGNADSTATVQQWQNALRAVRYVSSSDDPAMDGATASRSIGFSVSDGTSTSNVLNSSINITAINDAPIATVTAVNPTFAEGIGSLQGSAVTLFSAASLSTVERNQTIVGMTFTASQMLDGLDEKIIIDGTPIILTVAENSTTNSGYMVNVALGSGRNIGMTTVTLSMASGIPTADAEILIQSIAFQNTKVDDPTTGNRIIALTHIKDSGGLANSGADTTPLNVVSTVNVVAVNDAPFAIADTAMAVEAGGIDNVTVGFDPSGNVLTNDTDVDLGDSKTVSALTNGVLGSAMAGSFGWLTLTKDGNYTYTVDNTNAVVQSLCTSSDWLSDTFTYTLRDSAGLSGSNTLTVMIQGMNDAPVITAMTPPASVIDGSDNERRFTPVVGTIAAEDVDGTISYAVETGLNTWGTSKTGSYGTLTISESHYRYAPDATKVNALTAGSNLTDSFMVVVTDDQGDQARQTLTFSILGANDGPVVIEASPVNLVEGDQLVIIDLLDNAHDVDSDRLSVTDILIKINKNAVSAASVGIGITDHFLTLNSDIPFFDKLSANDRLEVHISYKIYDGFIFVPTARIATITGSNDVAIITPATPSITTVQEDVALTATGKLAVYDPDSGEQALRATAQDKPLQGKYGRLSITSNGAWIYTLNNSLAIVQNLNDGQSLNDEQFTLVTIDGTGVVQLRLSVKGQDEFILPLPASSASASSGTPGADMTPMLVLAAAKTEAASTTVLTPSSLSFRSSTSAASSGIFGRPLMGALGLGFLGGSKGGALAKPDAEDPGTAINGVTDDDPVPASIPPARDRGENQEGNKIPKVGDTPADANAKVRPATALPLRDQLAVLRKPGPAPETHFRKSFNDQIRTAQRRYAVIR